MKRIIAAVIAIVSAISISFVGFFAVNNSCKKLTTHLERLCETTQKEDVSAAVNMSDEAVALWEGVHDLIESFIRHEETDKLEEIIKSLPTFARQGEMERLEQQTELALEEIEHLLRNEKPLISNIF